MIILDIVKCTLWNDFFQCLVNTAEISSNIIIQRWGHSRGSAATESKVLAGEPIYWSDKADTSAERDGKISDIELQHKKTLRKHSSF